MINAGKVVRQLELQLDDLQKYAADGELLTLTQEQAKEIIALLKEREPKHGHWIDLQNCSNAGVYCSECHVKVFPYYPMKKKLSLFCPHCGAKMDGETVEFNG